MMMQNDVSMDLKRVVESVEKGDGPVPSVLKILKMGAVFPLCCLIFYASALAWIIGSYVPPEGDRWVNPVLHHLGGMMAVGAFIFILSMVMAITYYGPSLIYLSIPKEVRDKSAVINNLKSLFGKLCAVFVIFNGLFAILCMFMPTAYYGAPAVLLLSFAAFQIIMGMEVTRYGVAPMISRLNKISKKY